MYIYIFMEIAAIIYLPFHWSAKNLSLQYRSQVNIRASTHMWNKSIRSQGKLISYSGRLRNTGFEILCQDFISFLSIIFNSSVLCPHPHRTPEPRSKVSENFIFCVCVFVKMYSFSHFTNHETSSLLTYKHIIRNICKIFEWTLGMFTENLKALCRLWPKCIPYPLIICDRTCRLSYCKFLDVKMNSELHSVHFSTREENEKSIPASDNNNVMS